MNTPHNANIEGQSIIRGNTTFSTGPSSLPNTNNQQHSDSVATDQSSLDVAQLEQHCKNLEDELDQVKFQIVKIVSDKNDYNKENAVLKTYQNAFAALTEQNELLKRKVEQFSVMEATQDSRQERIDPPTLISSNQGRQMPVIDRSSPDGQEKDPDLQSKPPEDVNLVEEILKLKAQLAEAENAVIKDKKSFEIEKMSSIERNK